VRHQYEVPGISCDHCKQAIEQAVSVLEGVEGVHVDVETKLVDVVGPVSVDDVTAAIDEAGYEVTAVR
jgi:copper ion binding protein